jgi:hypothetical protein
MDPKRTLVQFRALALVQAIKTLLIGGRMAYAVKFTYYLAFEKPNVGMGALAFMIILPVILVPAICWILFQTTLTVRVFRARKDLPSPLASATLFDIVLALLIFRDIPWLMVLVLVVCGCELGLIGFQGGRPDRRRSPTKVAGSASARPSPS